MAKRIDEKKTRKKSDGKGKFFNRFRKGNKNRTSVVTEEKLPSAAKVSNTPQIDHHGLSYAGQHLVLLLQHYVDVQHIKVPSNNVSWENLVTINLKVDLLKKKERAKEFCAIHHFSPKELDEIAHRVTKFVKVHQSHMVNF